MSLYRYAANPQPFIYDSLFCNHFYFKCVKMSLYPCSIINNERLNLTGLNVTLSLFYYSREDYEARRRAEADQEELDALRAAVALRQWNHRHGIKTTGNQGPKPNRKKPIPAGTGRCAESLRAEGLVPGARSTRLQQPVPISRQGPRPPRGPRPRQQRPPVTRPPVRYLAYGCY